MLAKLLIIIVIVFIYLYRKHCRPLHISIIHNTPHMSKYTKLSIFNKPYMDVFITFNKYIL